MSVSEDWAGTAMCPGCYTAGRQIDLLHIEVTELNDALSAALTKDIGNETLADVMRRRYGRECEQWRHNHDQRKAERDAERSAHTYTKSQLDEYKAGAVLRSDHEALRKLLFSARGERDAALANVDALTAELARERDKRANVTSKRALDMLERVMATLTKETTDPKDECVRAEARAILVEMGRRAPEVEGMRSHSEKWLAERGQR